MLAPDPSSAIVAAGLLSALACLAAVFWAITGYSQEPGLGHLVGLLVALHLYTYTPRRAWRAFGQTMPTRRPRSSGRYRGGSSGAREGSPRRSYPRSRRRRLPPRARRSRSHLLLPNCLGAGFHEAPVARREGSHKPVVLRGEEHGALQATHGCSRLEVLELPSGKMADLEHGSAWW